MINDVMYVTSHFFDSLSAEINVRYNSKVNHAALMTIRLRIRLPNVVKLHCVSRKAVQKVIFSSLRGVYDL